MTNLEFLIRKEKKIKKNLLGLTERGNQAMFYLAH